MSTICIPLMFSQKAQELKPYDMLNNQSENFQQLHVQLLSTAADMQPPSRAAVTEFPLQSSDDSTTAVLPLISHSQEGKKPKKSTNRSQAVEH